jgi:hypothetical protein
VSVANNGILAAENVAITATTTNTGIRLGTPIHIALMQPFSHSDLTIPVTLLPTAPRNTNITISLHITGEDTCDKAGVNVSLSMRTGVDDIANASNIDHAETKLSAWTATGDGAASVWGRVIETGGNQLFFGKDSGSPSDTQFVSPPLVVRTTEPFVVKLSHAYAFEGSPGTLFDGGMIEVSTDGGVTWNDVTTFGVNPGYTGALFVGSDNPLAGRQAFSGTSPGFPARSLLTLDFGMQFAGQTVQVRFRVGTDAAVAVSGWNIDDIEVDGITNTPFPILVSELATCTARKASVDESLVVATQVAPATSLRAADAAVCILNDTP